jgi:hypothetical protein
MMQILFRNLFDPGSGIKIPDPQHCVYDEVGLTCCICILSVFRIRNFWAFRILYYLYGSGSFNP